MSANHSKNTQRLLDSIGRFFKEKRVDAGKTQKEAADYLGITAQYISNMERGCSVFPNSYKRKLLKLYKINPHHFVDFMLEQQEIFLHRELKIKS